MSKRIILFFFLYIAFLLAASGLFGSVLWGASCWISCSFTLAVVLALFSLTLISGGVRNLLLEIFPEDARKARWGAVVWSIVAVLAAYIFRYGHDFWGGRLQAVAAMEGGVWTVPAAPLGLFINNVVFHLLNSSFLLNASTSTVLLSILSGAGFVLAAAGLARAALPDDGARPRSIAILFLSANGYFALFFGAGGNVPVAVALAALFILYSILYLRQKAKAGVVVLLLALCVTVHISTLYLVPGAVYVLLAGPGRNGGPRKRLLPLLMLILSFAVVETGIVLLTGSPGILGRAIRLASPSSGWISLISPWERLLSTLNVLLILGPSFAAAVFLHVSRAVTNRSTDRSRRLEERFLLITAACGVLMIAAGAYRIDGGIRWDIFAAAGPAISIYLLWLLSGTFSGGKDLSHILFLLSMLGIFHTLPVIITNASTRAGESRILRLPLEEGRGATIIGLREIESEDFDGAEKWFQLASQENPSSDIPWFNLGLIGMHREDYLDAITYFNRAVERRPADQTYRLDLAEAFIEQRWFEEAITNLEILTNEHPDSARYWTRLGFANNHSNRFDAAIKAYERALALDGSNETYVINLTSAVLNKGAELQQEGRTEEAKKLYYRARLLYPMDYTAQNNLAAIEMEAGNWQKAHDILEAALRDHPMTPKLHFNMGIVQEKLGNYEEALYHLKKSAEYDPMSPAPIDHINRIEKELAESRGESPGEKP